MSDTEEIVTPEEKRFEIPDEVSEEPEHPEDDQPKGDQPDDEPEKDKKPDEDEGKKKPKRRNRTERYIRNLTREAQEAKEQAAYLKGQLEALQKEQNVQPEPKKPDRWDFDSEDEYLDALTDYKLDLREKARQKPEQKESPKEPPVAPQVNEQFLEFEQKGVEAYGDDFIAALQDPTLTVTDTMADVLLDSEQGPDLIMYLSDNPREAARIAGLGSAAQVRALDKLATQVEDQEQPQPRKQSAAPPPVTPEKGGTAPVVTNLEDVQDIDEWMRKRNETKKTW